jgi:hypothetical protein
MACKKNDRAILQEIHRRRQLLADLAIKHP